MKNSGSGRQSLAKALMTNMDHNQNINPPVSEKKYMLLTVRPFQRM
jgi:hypothetical protein